MPTRLSHLITPQVIASAAPVPHRLFADGPALNRVCRPDAWDDPEWLGVLRALDLPPEIVHRKAFEWAHAIYGLERLNMLGPERTVLGVGAGHEHILYHLANRTKLTVATDIYAGHFVDTPAAEADPDFLAEPEKYAPFPYRRDHLVGLPADGLKLPFKDDCFDVVYSLSSIEHFGGYEMASVAMQEMARVLKLGGVACVATELVLEGPANHEFFPRDLFDRCVVGASGLVPVEQLDDEPPPRELFDDPVQMDNINRNPHIVMGAGPMRWTSVIVFLRKPTRLEAAAWGAMGAARKVRERISR